MEGYVAVVGNIPCIEAWETDMRAIKLPYKYKKEEKKGLLRLGVAEMKLYKIFFPKEHLDTVMSLIGVSPTGSHVLKGNKILAKGIKMLRRMLGLKEMPLPTKIVEHMQPDQTEKAVAVIPLGIKEDNFDENGIEMI